MDARRPPPYCLPTTTATTIATRSPSPYPTLPLLPTPQRTTTTSIPFKCLTLEELAVRHEKGLCFHYDEKFSRGHKCSSSLFLFVTKDEELTPQLAPPCSPSPTHDLLPEPPPAQLSLHALSGHSAPETLPVQGFIGDFSVSILVDGGSTYNFLHHRVVMALGISPTETAPLRVTVGNRDEIRCHQLCTAVTVQIQGHSFTIDFHILLLCGANVVLGVQWLKTLRPILIDYTSLTMKFIAGGKLIELHSDREKDGEPMSPSQLRHLFHTNPTITFFHIRIEALSQSSLAIQTLPEIVALTTKYASMFQPLASLPLSRPTNHTIPLLPNSASVNVKPYRYPYYQK